VTVTADRGRSCGTEDQLSGEKERDAGEQWTLDSKFLAGHISINMKMYNSGETPCIKERNNAFSTAEPLLGAFVPDCDEKGYFSPSQFHGSTGYSWCVTKNGEEIKGTRTGPGQTPPTCEVRVASEIFSASCAPGAQEANLCEQCAGQEDKCTRGPGEPYYGDEGAFR
ncbi:unnamed protein product, partial [Ranitomeya imitator]